jgi:hypothetical protein
VSVRVTSTVRTSSVSVVSSYLRSIAGSFPRLPVPGSTLAAARLGRSTSRYPVSVPIETPAIQRVPTPSWDDRSKEPKENVRERRRAGQRTHRTPPRGDAPETGLPLVRIGAHSALHARRSGRTRQHEVPQLRAPVQAPPAARLGVAGTPVLVRSGRLCPECPSLLSGLAVQRNGRGLERLAPRGRHRSHGAPTRTGPAALEDDPRPPAGCGPRSATSTQQRAVGARSPSPLVRT